MSKKRGVTGKEEPSDLNKTGGNAENYTREEC